MPVVIVGGKDNKTISEFPTLELKAGAFSETALEEKPSLFQRLTNKLLGKAGA